MKESEYIRATNRAKVSAALVIMRDVLPDNDLNFGVTCKEQSEIIIRMRNLEEKLFSSFTLSED